MEKAKVLQILSALLIITGCILLFMKLADEGFSTGALAGIGPIVMGVALFIMARNIKQNTPD